MSHTEINSAQKVQNQSKRFILLVVVPAVALLAFGIVYLLGGRYVSSDNAYVKADKIPVSSTVSGAVTDVFVQENQAVKTGQLLYRIDTAQFQVAIAKSEARLAQVRTDIAALKASYREKQAEILLAQTRYDFALKEQQRQADLLARGYISPSRFDEARQSTDIAAQQVAALKEDQKRIAETLGGSAEMPVEQSPAFRVALAELAQARLDLQHTEVKASLPGVVSKPPKVGQFVAAGSPVMALVVSGKLWIEANFTETDLTHVHPGQAVEIHVDTYPAVKWQGEVESLSPATGAEFSLIPAQNATGNWVKIAQRVAVKININAQPDMPQLRAGLSTEVEIDTGHKRKVLGITL